MSAEINRKTATHNTKHNPQVLKHPVLQEILAVLRDKQTSSPQFRSALRRAGYHQTYEIIGRECSLETTRVKTVFRRTEGYRIREKMLQIMVMRAGQPYAEGGAVLLDELEMKRAVGVIDARREEQEHSIKFDFSIDLGSIKVPKFDRNTIVIIYDPMLASGSTLKKILERIKSRGRPKRIIICSIISAKYGIHELLKSHPDVRIYTLAVDDAAGTRGGLNDEGFIVPGLGDAGDRAFGEYNRMNPPCGKNKNHHD